MIGKPRYTARSKGTLNTVVVGMQTGGGTERGLARRSTLCMKMQSSFSIRAEQQQIKPNQMQQQSVLTILSPSIGYDTEEVWQLVTFTHTVSSEISAAHFASFS